MTHSTSRQVLTPTRAMVDEARSAVTTHLTPTPTLLSPRLGPRTLLKLESLMPTGSFKVRGAVAALTAAPPTARIVTASAGNHGLAVAWAAERLGRSATVVIPRTASRAKADALERFSCGLEYAGDSYDDAEARALELAAAGKRYVSPYNDPWVVAGQATLGFELDSRAGPLTVYVPVGGGGLLAGVCLWAQDRADVRVVGVEAAASPGMSEALRAGSVVPVTIHPTLADGLAGNLEPGSITVPIAAARVDEMLAVGEGEIREAIRFLVREHGTVAEGSGAVAVAALLHRSSVPPGTSVALVTGSNIATTTLVEVLTDADPE